MSIQTLNTHLKYHSYDLYLDIRFLCVHQLLNNHAQALSDGHVTGRGSGKGIFSGVRVPVALWHENGSFRERLVEITHRLWVLQGKSKQKNIVF